MTIAAQLVTKVVADTKDAEAGLDNIGKKSSKSGGLVKGFIGQVSSIATGIGVVKVASEAFGFLKDQVGSVFEAGISQQKVMADTTQVLKTMGNVSGQTADSIGEFADKEALATGISDDLVQHAENVMLTFGNIGGKVFPAATQAAVDMSSRLGQDLQSSVVMVGKALNDPINGFSALQRVGVSFTQSEKDQITSMQKSGNLMGAQSVILGELQKQFGGAAVAAGNTFGGQMSRLGVVLDQAKEKIGLALIPVLSRLLTNIMPLVTAFGQWLPGAISAASTWFKANLQPVLDKLGAWIAADGVPALKSFAAFITGNIVPAARQMFSWFSANVVPILQTLWTVIQTDVLPTLRGVASQVLTQLVPALQNLIGKLSPVLIPALNLIGWTLSHVVGPALSVVIGIISRLANGISFLVDKIGGLLGKLGQLRDKANNIPVLGGVLSHIPGFAEGGVMGQTGLAMVGEKGPEMVILPGASRVIPHTQTQALMASSANASMRSSGGGFGSTIHIHGADANQVYSELRRQSTLLRMSGGF